MWRRVVRGWVVHNFFFFNMIIKWWNLTKSVYLYIIWWNMLRQAKSCISKQCCFEVCFEVHIWHFSYRIFLYFFYIWKHLLLVLYSVRAVIKVFWARLTIMSKFTLYVSLPYKGRPVQNGKKIKILKKNILTSNAKTWGCQHN